MVEHKTIEQRLDPTEIRLEFGEAWMWCQDCNAKLYSFDGHKDACTRCPHPKKCEAERHV